MEAQREKTADEMTKEELVEKYNKLSNENWQLNYQNKQLKEKVIDFTEGLLDIKNKISKLEILKFEIIEYLQNLEERLKI